MSSTILATTENFQDTIDDESLTLVDFWAEWCGPCKIMDEPLKQLSETMRVAKLNVDDYPELSHKYSVQSIPTMIVFRNGEEVIRMVGARPLSEIELHITKVSTS